MALNYTIKGDSYGEPILLTMSGFATGFDRLRIRSTTPAFTGEYQTTDTSGKITIDIAPIVRLVNWTSSRMELTLLYSQRLYGQWSSETPIFVYINQLRDFNKVSVFIPSPTGDNEGWSAFLKTPPPSCIIEAASDESLAFEALMQTRVETIQYADVRLDNGTHPYWRQATTNQLYTRATSGGALAFKDVNNNIIECKERDCSKKYCLIQWLGHFGGINSLPWEVRNVKIATQDTQSLMQLDGGYNTHKGEEITFTAHLDNLTAYDYWFYSSLATSTAVRTGDDNTTTVRVRVGGAWIDAEVDTKSVTIPNSDETSRHSLDINVKLLKYVQI